MSDKSFQSIEQEFTTEFKITLKEAIDRINSKLKEAIDYDFLLSMYDDEYYRDIVLNQIQEITEKIKGLLSIRDNFSSRMVLKAIKETDEGKKESDDTRLSRKIIDKEKVIQSIITSDYKFNPIIELNPSIYPEKSYPIIYVVTKEFRDVNKNHIETIYYKGSRHIKRIRVIRGHEHLININRDMVIDIDLRQYPFYIRREIQNANFNSLRG